MEKIISNFSNRVTVQSRTPGSQNAPVLPLEENSPDLLDDATLMHLLALNQEDALAGLYDRYGRLVYSIAFASLGDRTAAEEIVQDVFTRAWKKADTYDARIAGVNTWLASITRHRVIDELRRERAHPERNGVEWFDLSLDEELASERPEDDSELLWRQKMVKDALNSVSPNERKALALAYFKGYSQSEIAAILGIPLGTVKTRIRSAMQKMRLYLSQTIQGD